MKYLALMGLCVNLVASTPEEFPMFRLEGRLSGLAEPSTRLVDLRLLFFARRSGGHPVGDRRIQSVNLDDGRFSVPLDLTGLTRRLKSPRVYVEIGLRPAGRRYARYTPVGPRRALRIGGYLVWRLEDPPPGTAKVRSHRPVAYRKRA